MEDLDPLREVVGAADSILHDLEQHGLHWDGELSYQSQRTQYYEDVAQQLLQGSHAFCCFCTRKFLLKTANIGENGIIYPGHCRDLFDYDASKQHSIRLKTPAETICFDDERMGVVCQHLEMELGDFIIRRSDGYHAYQLAVVIDDYLQGITEVVRGADLLNNTQRQIYLQRLLNYPQVSYLHLPLVMNADGQKLSKQTHAEALDLKTVSYNLVYALQALGIETDKALLQAEPSEILAWGVNRHSQLLNPN